MVWTLSSVGSRTGEEKMRRLAGCSAESPREAALWRVEAQSLADAPYGTVPPSSTALATTHLEVSVQATWDCVS